MIEVSKVLLEENLTTASGTALALDPRIRIPARSMSDGAIFDIEVMAKIVNGATGDSFKALVVPVVSYVGDTTAITNPATYGCSGYDSNPVSPSGGGAEIFIRCRSMLRFNTFSASGETSQNPSVSAETFVSQNSLGTSTQVSGGSYTDGVNCAQELELRPYFFYEDGSAEGATISNYYCKVTVTTPTTGRSGVTTTFYD